MLQNEDSQCIWQLYTESASVALIEVRGKYLKFPNGAITSISSDSSVVFDNRTSGETLRVTQDRNGLYGHTGRWDKRFASLDELAKFLNQGSWRYVGVDLGDE